MGIYLNPNNDAFKESREKSIYVDKSLLIKEIYEHAKKINKYICLTRPRRFGKSYDANMLVAYFSKGCDSSPLFDDLKIAKESDYEKHINKYDVIHLDMLSFYKKNKTIEEMISLICDMLLIELKLAYPNVYYYKEDDLTISLNNIYNQKKNKFIFIIDEWDCILRKRKEDKEGIKLYLDFLRNLFKEQSYINFVYMTGILPIKKYGTHSTLNMFDEISMINSYPLENFMGFTENEVKNLSEQYHMDFNEIKDWYNGYHLKNNVSLYCPQSIDNAIINRKYDNYWTSTETYEALKIYIDMNFDGLKEDIIRMLAGKRVYIDPKDFQNDMVSFDSKDDVFTLLVHLGYLAYNSSTSEVYIPNREVMNEFERSIKHSSWNETIKTLTDSIDLLNYTWNMNEEKVAQYIERTHQEMSHLKYNSEECLSYVVEIAYQAARDHYTKRLELASGKGYCDIAYIPKLNKPAMIIELKWNKDAYTAINQIKEKHYYEGLEDYLDNLLLVGITYNRDSKDKEYKQHSCIIEKYKN